MSPGDFAHEILGQLQVTLRTGQADVAKVCGQERQLRAEVDILFAPQQKAEQAIECLRSWRRMCRLPLVRSMPAVFSVWWNASRKAVIEYRPPRGLGKNGFSGAPPAKCLVASVRQRASC